MARTRRISLTAQQEQAARMLGAGATVAAVHRNLGISRASIHKWKRGTLFKAAIEAAKSTLAANEQSALMQHIFDELNKRLADPERDGPEEKARRKRIRKVTEAETAAEIRRLWRMPRKVAEDRRVTLVRKDQDGKLESVTYSDPNLLANAMNMGSKPRDGKKERLIPYTLARQPAKAMETKRPGRKSRGRASGV